VLVLITNKRKFYIALAIAIGLFAVTVLTVCLSVCLSVCLDVLYIEFPVLCLPESTGISKLKFPGM